MWPIHVTIGKIVHILLVRDFCVSFKLKIIFTRFSFDCLCLNLIFQVETPSQVIIHQYDSYQLSQNIASPPRLWTYDACKYANSQFRPLMKETIGQLMFTNQHVVFAPACYDHGLVQSNVRFMSYLKCSDWRGISRLSSNFGCLFTFCYLDGPNSIKTNLHTVFPGMVSALG